uniref:Uncharacterized protein n=1 Tax=Triticum urartu TaxID=4572 RepID=A0A8R7TRZ0_TRIUA
RPHISPRPQPPPASSDPPAGAPCYSAPTRLPLLLESSPPGRPSSTPPRPGRPPVPCSRTRPAAGLDRPPACPALSSLRPAAGGTLTAGPPFYLLVSSAAPASLLPHALSLFISLVLYNLYVYETDDMFMRSLRVYEFDDMFKNWPLLVLCTATMVL